MATMITAREAGERLGLEHLEVIRRLRKGDIKGTKWGWNWAISEKEVDRVRKADWYLRLMERRGINVARPH